MPKFLIDVPHDPDVLACARVVQVFLASGSHFLTNAEWGCMDGEHRAWMLVEVDSRSEAQSIVPPGLRTHATVVQLNRFSMEEIDDIMKRHSPKPAVSRQDAAAHSSTT